MTYDAAQLAKLFAGVPRPRRPIQGANQAHLVVQGRFILLPRKPPVRGETAILPGINVVTSSVLRPPAALALVGRQWQITADAGWNAANLYGLRRRPRAAGGETLCATARSNSPHSTRLAKAASPPSLGCRGPAARRAATARRPLASNVAISPEVKRSRC